MIRTTIFTVVVYSILILYYKLKFVSNPFSVEIDFDQFIMPYSNIFIAILADNI